VGCILTPLCGWASVRGGRPAQKILKVVKVRASFRAGHNSPKFRAAIADLFCRIALPGPNGSSGDAESQKNYYAHDDPALRNVHHESAVSQPGSKNQISD
jgi:hypothetical protein